MIINNYCIAFRRHVLITILISLLFFTSLSTISGQKAREEPPPIKERLFYGGSFGLQFGTITDIQISPVIGLWVLPRLAVAVGPDYRFYKDTFGRTNVYGGKGYLQFVVIQDISSFIPIGGHTGIFLHCEDELLSLQSSFWKYPPYTSDRFYLNTILAGGGISQQLGRRSSLNLMVLWALNNSGYDVYGNPEIRISFNF
ncbi:MAG TPA: hypothetical protein VMV77_19020 [Bacteroidales bacterium]|nr:hypothetical protein [Bacteroidales bacterium]